MHHFRFPSFSQWKKLPGVLSRNEKIIASLFALCVLGSTIFFTYNLYNKHTVLVPAKGGSIREGIMGSPHFINPVFSDASDADRDLVQLIFSGLFTYDAKGAIAPDLAKSYTISGDGKTIDVILKDRLFWSDGSPLTANDVVFTISTIQDPKYKSPIRANWVGVDVQKISDSALRFQLQQPYAPFLERLTLKIIPMHIWENISPENFALSVYNIQPIGSGTWRIKKIMREKSGSIKEIQLIPNAFYAGKKPFIQSFTFAIYENEERLLSALRSNEIQSFSPENPKYLPKESDPLFSAYRLYLPRYFALFFNIASEIPNDPIKQKDIRQALAGALDTTELVKKLFGVNGKTVSSPFLPNLFGFASPDAIIQKSANDSAALFLKQGYTNQNGKLVKTIANGGLQQDLAEGSTNISDVKKLQTCLARDASVYPEGTISGIFGKSTKTAVIQFQEKYAKEILTPNNLSSGTGKVGLATRQKLNAICFSNASNTIPLTITLNTIDQYPLTDVANEIKNQWENVGVTTEIRTQNSTELERDTIKPRNFQVLLFGEVLGTIPDPFPFWYSSQKKDPGLNLSSYENKKLDALLEQARKEFDSAKRTGLYQQMQAIVLSDVPAIALYDTPYLYVTSSKIKGIETGLIADPSQRFSNITNWYIKTKRAWK